MNLAVQIRANKEAYKEYKPEPTDNFILDEDDFNTKIDLKQLEKDLNVNIEEKVKEKHIQNKTAFSLYCCLCAKNKKKYASQPNDISVVKFFNVDVTNVNSSEQVSHYKNKLCCLDCLEK